MEPEGISPEEAHKKVKSGKCFLVCAYEDEQKCKLINLEGAISLAEFKRRLPLLSRDQESKSCNPDLVLKSNDEYSTAVAGLKEET